MFALTPSHFVNMYNLFSSEGRLFISKDYQQKETHRIYNNIILFNPVTLHPTFNPVTRSLEKALDSIEDIDNYKLLIIPFCESSSFLELRKSNHMITLVIDNSLKKIFLIDSRSFTIPNLSKTEEIKQTLEVYFDYSFERIYLRHQSIFDIHSCCYFSILVIFFLLKFKGNTKIFFSFLPKPDTLITTSKNFLNDNLSKIMLEYLENH